MHIRVSDVKKWVGRQEAKHFCEEWPELVQERSPYPMRGAAEMDVTVRNVGRALIVELEGLGHVEAVCSRCLETFDLVVPFSAAEEFREEPGASDPNEDFFRFQGDKVFLDEVVADVFGASIPYAPVCGDECQGLCPVCGKNLNAETCHCETSTDNRWTVLSQLEFPDDPSSS
ncbi:MAG: DUF177 domain-containing protein [Firmicutes bacterium]|jgi:uncharacterized protein|uniref:DUF177 domain-containing protein n=1 Tax=Sulfobacillus benefaciens TaxID=453960 RepID=A0A2T2XAN0_9FIRM|nr:DUF177 domain-containing protein [Bacillota bacterium]PSR31506.1 MAG: DUF177 domain-containing protein [Sulfobacillus benefaciens]HBQ95789.1 DUF177 domain-containing protein [Sulfobacillus sp.]